MTEESPAPVLQPEPVADTFFNHLTDYFQSYEIQNWFRIAREGFFADESGIERLIEAYHAWTKKITPGGEGRSIEKCRKKLLGTERLELFYVLDGKRCLAGFILPVEKPDPKRSKIPLYQVNLLPAKDYLHPRDPFLATLENPKPRLSNEGFALEFELAGKKAEVSEAALREFATALRAHPRERRTYPEIGGALRNAIAPLARYLTDSREGPPNQRLLVPDRFRTKPGLKFYRTHGMFLVIEGEKKFIGCFSTKGKALGRFLRSEIESMKGEMRGFAPGSPKKHCVGKTFSQGIAFHLHIRTLLQFLKQIPRVQKVNEKMPQRYGVRDVLERFAGIFRNTKPTDERELLGKLRRREAFAKYRQTGNWVFVVTDKNTLSSCVHLSGKDRRSGRRESAEPQKQR